MEPEPFTCYDSESRPTLTPSLRRGVPKLSLLHEWAGSELNTKHIWLDKVETHPQNGPSLPRTPADAGPSLIWT